MRRVRFVSVALCLLVAVSLVGARQAQAPPSPQSLALDAQALTTSLRQEVEARQLVGLSLAVVRDGKVLFAGGAGRRSIADAAPVTPDTRFAIGSVTKQFTCACVLLLAEDGKLAVTDKVSKWFPTLTKADEITVLDLMNHVSGYPDYYPLDFVDRPMQKPIALDELIARFGARPLDFAPRSRYSVQQHRVRDARAHRVEGGRRTVRRVPKATHPRPARPPQHRLRAQPGERARVRRRLRHLGARAARGGRQGGTGLGRCRGRALLHAHRPGRLGHGARRREVAQAAVLRVDDDRADADGWHGLRLRLRLRGPQAGRPGRSSRTTVRCRASTRSTLSCRPPGRPPSCCRTSIPTRRSTRSTPASWMRSRRFPRKNRLPRTPRRRRPRQPPTFRRLLGRPPRKPPACSSCNCRRAR